MERQNKLRLIAVVLTLSVLGALGGVAEWSVRHREAVRETVPGGATPGVYYRHNRTRFAFVRDNDYFHWIRINSLGFRGKETTVEKPDGVFRILAVGGSTTFDRGVTANELAWPSRLEAHLNELDGGQTFEVINAGVPGYMVLDNLIRLQIELTSFDPDLIILYHAHNDLFAAMRTTTGVWTARPDEFDPPKLVDTWFDRSLLYSKVRGRLMLIANGRALTSDPLPPFEDRLNNGLEDFRSGVASFVSIAQAHGIPTLLPTVVTVDQSETEFWSNSFPSASPGEVAVGYDAYNAVIREVGEALGASVVATDSFGVDTFEFYEEGDPIHFNDAGAEEWARQLAPALLERIQSGEFTASPGSVPPAIGVG